MLKKVLSLIIGNDDTTGSLRVPKKHQEKKLTERSLIQLESEIGSKLFGDVPKGHRREFFCLDESTWIWYEEWLEPKTNRRRNMTVRYEVHKNGILKVQEGARYSFLEGEELKNFTAAVKVYHDKVAREVYLRDPLSGQKFA